MHWTDVLARRLRVPPDALVADDLACAGCGYNLRGMLTGGSCPECNTAVRTSLAMLQAPDRVASALRGLARSYFTLLAAFLLAGFAAGHDGVGWIGVGLLLVGAAYRGITAFELLSAGKLRRLAMVARRIRWIINLVVIEVALGLAAGAAIYSASAAVAVRQVLVGSLSLWAAATLLDLISACLMGSSLALLLGYDFVERELFRARAALAGGLAVVAGAVLLGLIALSVGGLKLAGALMLVGVGLLVLACSIGAGMGIVGLLHLASAAERERDIREDVLEK